MKTIEQDPLHTMQQVMNPITNTIFEPVAQRKRTPYEMWLIALSVVMLIILVGDAIIHWAPRTERVLLWVENLICCVFIYDFIQRFKKASSKWQFMKWGWVDALACVPTIPWLYGTGAERIFRLARIIRGAKAAKVLFEILFSRKIKGALATVVILAVTITFAAAVSVVKMERNHPNANIKTFDDSLWWAVVTITTVGYGDRYPVTPEGRLIAGFLMVCGIGLFGTATGFIASRFLDKEKEQNDKIDTIEELAEEVRGLKTMLAAPTNVQVMQDALKWYAASHRPEDYLNDTGERARYALRGIAPKSCGCYSHCICDVAETLEKTV